MDARPRVTPRSYLDFQPLSEWLQAEQSTDLLVTLPGFRKEQIKVQVDNFGNLRVSGERPLSGAQWSRFRKDFRIPQNCNTSEIRAKFENGLLTITFPKLVSRTRMQDQPKPAPVPPVSQRVSEPKPREDPERTNQVSSSSTAPGKLNGTAEKQAKEKPSQLPGILGEAMGDNRKDEPRMQEKAKDQTTVVEDVKKAASDMGEKAGEAAGEMKGKLAAEDVTSGGVGNGLEKFKYRVGRPRLAIKKSRQLMVNVVVAIVVLVGLALYLSYKLRTSIEEDSN